MFPSYTDSVNDKITILPMNNNVNDAHTKSYYHSINLYVSFTVAHQEGSYAEQMASLRLESQWDEIFTDIFA